MKCGYCEKDFHHREQHRCCTLKIWPYDEEKLCSVTCLMDFINRYHKEEYE